MDAGFCIFSLFELCGISSFNLSPEELKRWSYHFDKVYGVEILEPPGGCPRMRYFFQDQGRRKL
jgi:hypothetical protein